MLVNLRAVLARIVDIVLLRAGPETLPASSSLFAAVVLVNVAVTALTYFLIPNAPDDWQTPIRSYWRDYLQDGGPKWAQALAAMVTTPAFINKDMQAIFVQPDWLDTLNLVFFKIDQLDPTVTSSVLKVWMAAYPDKNIVSNWSHRQFVPYENISQAPGEFLPDVNAAISIGTDAQDGADCKVYGHEVWLFLTGYPKTLNFVTGARPSNKVDNDPWSHHKFLGL